MDRHLVELKLESVPSFHKILLDFAFDPEGPAMGGYQFRGHAEQGLDPTVSYVWLV